MIEPPGKPGIAIYSSTKTTIKDESIWSLHLFFGPSIFGRSISHPILFYGSICSISSICSFYFSTKPPQITNPTPWSFPFPREAHRSIRAIRTSEVLPGRQPGPAQVRLVAHAEAVAAAELVQVLLLHVPEPTPKVPKNPGAGGRKKNKTKKKNKKKKTENTQKELEKKRLDTEKRTRCHVPRAPKTCLKKNSQERSMTSGSCWC